jgi:uncharacterized protein (TIGR02598 family)
MTNPLLARRRGFSLIEVVTALGIVAICVLTLMGLLAVGINSNKTTVNQSIAVNIAGAVAADLRATPLITQSYSTSETRYSPRFGFRLPANTSSNPNGIQSVYVSDEGTPLTAVNASLPAGTASYRVTVEGPSQPSVSNQRTASPVFILVTWPGQADPNPSQSGTPTWPSNYAGSFQVVTYLDQN